MSASPWVPVGVSDSRLHIFVDRHSVVSRGSIVEAVVRIGSPGLIAGRIAIVYELEQFDCGRRVWRLLRYRGVDGDHRPVATRQPTVTRPFLRVLPGTIGEATLDTVCTIATRGPEATHR